MLVAVGLASNGLCESYQYQPTVSDRDTNLTCFPDSWKELEKHSIIMLKSKESCSPVEVLRCYCLSLSANAIYSIGRCAYSCFFYRPRGQYHLVRFDNKSESNGTCSQFNREGVLCGQCREGYGPPVYSFTLKCVPCRNVSLWTTASLYVLIAYGPLTVFLAVIVFFTLSVNSAPLRGFILVCQLITFNDVVRVLVAYIEIDHIPISFHVKVLTSVYGVWNLDFFRSVYKPFCLHPSLTTLQVMSLDYIIAAYPLVLIIGMYVLVDLYSRNYRPVVVVGRIFHHCCIRFRHQLNIRTSLVDAFCTFFSLSYVKFLSTSVNLLMYATVLNTDNTRSHRVYFDGTMEYFRGDHIPFAATAVTLITLCNVLPLIIILLYAFPRTHVVLNILPASVRAAMFPFMDNILACYKDGTNGTRNCRYFGVVYHLAMVAYMLPYTLTPSMMVYGLNAFVCIVVGMLVAVIQPYKSKLYNTVDIILILGVGLSYVGAMCLILTYYEVQYKITAGLVLTTVPATIPLFYIAGFIVYKCLSKIHNCWSCLFTPWVKLKLRLSSLFVRSNNSELSFLTQ